MSIKDYWFIKQSNDIIKWTVITLLILSVGYLVMLSIIKPDLNYPQNHPYLFTTEILLFSLGSGLVIFFMAYGRDNLTLFTIVDYLIVAVKFGILHLLLQLSGFYSYVFS